MIKALCHLDFGQTCVKGNRFIDRLTRLRPVLQIATIAPVIGQVRFGQTHKSERELWVLCDRLLIKLNASLVASPGDANAGRTQGESPGLHIELIGLQDAGRRCTGEIGDLAV